MRSLARPTEGNHLMFNAPRLFKAIAVTIALGSMTIVSSCSNADPTSAPAPGADDPNKVTVGSFNYPESEILGEIYAQALEAKGLDVTKKFNIGPRQTTIPALNDGSINVIPEYNGNLLAYYNTEYTERTTEEVNNALGEAIKADKLRVLDSSPAEDKDAYVVTQKLADEKGLDTIGDLSKLVPFKLGANPQFRTLTYGLPGLQDVYGVGKKQGDVEFVQIEDFGGPDTVKALVDDSVQVADIYTTSPALVTEKLKVLDDPKKMISAQNVTPLLAESAYTPELGDALNAVSAQLTTEDLIALRERVEGKEKVSSLTAAKDWLKEKGLLEK